MSMIVEMFIAAIGAYVVYRQETLEKILNELRKDVSDLRRNVPKRWSDKLFDRESD